MTTPVHTGGEGSLDAPIWSAAGLVAALRAVMSRELAAVSRSVSAYPDDESLWRELPGAPNSGGTLVLHLVGNLRHFVGKGLGGTEYVRDREAEFSSRGSTRNDLLGLLDITAAEVDNALSTITPGQLGSEHALPLGGWLVRNDELLLHLAAHLAYHLGQLDYHRRIATGERQGVEAVKVAALPSARPFNG